MRFAELSGRFSSNKKRKGDQFEALCKWFLENDPRYADALEKVWLWADWPGRWGPDCGIDLVARDRLGRTWAIQAKGHAANRTVSKGDIDSFLTESDRPLIDERLLIASTNKVSSNADPILKNYDVHQVLLQDLENAWVDWPNDPDDLVGGGRLPPRTPQKHQQEAVDACCDGLAEHHRGQLVMACGTGKTLTALWIAEALEAQRTLVLLPSLSLLAQTLSEWLKSDSRGVRFLAVCSDETVVGKNEDQFTTSTSELGFPVTTDPGDIARFLGLSGAPLVIFSTYQSSPQIAEAMTQSLVPGLDLVVADEAHRCAGKTNTDFATVLETDLIRADRRLFMTATPRIYGESVRKRVREEIDLEIASMDDETKFGPVLHRLSFSEAIERELLTDYQVAVIGVDDAEYRSWAERGQLVLTDTGIETDARALAGQIGLAKAIAKYDLRKVITFHSFIKSADRFASSLPEVVAWMPADQRPVSPLECSHVSGRMPTGKRTARLAALRELDPVKHGVLSNARCLSEGVDVPTLDGVAFIDPRRSPVDIVQAVGRAIRIAEGKSRGTIVVPVFIDTDEDAEAALSTSAFKPVWDVVKALRAHDDDLAYELDQLRYQLGRYPKNALKRPPKIILDLPTNVTVDFAHAFDARLVEATTESWEFWFGLLVAFVESKGHAQVPQRYVTNDGHKLGVWVNTQRTSFDRSRLSPERIARLEALEGWTWDVHEGSWEERLRTLKGFLEQEGRAPAKKFVTEDGDPLGSWVDNQRTLYKNGELSPERIARLEALEGWTWQPKSEDWEIRYHALELFAQKEGHVDVPDDYVADDGYPVKRFIRNQKAYYNRNRLSPERIERLETLEGWQWGKREEAWEARFRALKSFEAREGHVLVPQSYVTEDGDPLGSWVDNQRTLYKNGELSPERIARLEALEGWTWQPKSEDWEIRYHALELFAQKEGHVDVPDDYVADDGYPVKRFIRNQKAYYNRNRLSPERIERLETLEGWQWWRSQ